jgi:hypothetical protein
MKCHEFNERATELTLAELAALKDEQLLTHERECADCRSWLQQRQALTGAMHELRSHTATLDAGVEVERSVLRAFRQSSPATREPETQPFAFALNRLFGWGAYAAVAAAIAVGLGLGVWYWQHSQQATQSAAQPPLHSVQQTVSAKNDSSEPVTAAQSTPEAPVKTPQSARVVVADKSTARTERSDQSLSQLAQAQGYVPLMLCDPLSCSGDEQVVRMEIPASAVEGYGNGSEPLMADVVVGDDGLVHAIRIVQQ